MIGKIIVYSLITAGVYYWKFPIEWVVWQDFIGPFFITLGIAVGISLIHTGIAWGLNKIVNSHGETKDWTAGTVSYGEEKIYTKDPFGKDRDEKTRSEIDKHDPDKIM